MDILRKNLEISPVWPFPVSKIAFLKSTWLFPPFSDGQMLSLLNCSLCPTDKLVSNVLFLFTDDLPPPHCDTNATKESNQSAAEGRKSKILLRPPASNRRGGRGLGCLERHALLSPCLSNRCKTFVTVQHICVATL